MTAVGKTFLVRRDALDQTRVDPFDADAALAPGQVQCRIEHFALTANNVTHAAFGDSLHYRLTARRLPGRGSGLRCPPVPDLERIEPHRLGDGVLPATARQTDTSALGRSDLAGAVRRDRDPRLVRPRGQLGRAATLRHSGSIGGTHHATLGTARGLPGPCPTLFFAPSRWQQRSTPPPQGLGRETLLQSMEVASRDFVARVTDPTAPLLVPQFRRGTQALREAWLQTLQGRGDSRQGVMIAR